MQAATPTAASTTRITFESNPTGLRIVEGICLVLLAAYAAAIPFQAWWHPLAFRILLAAWVLAWIIRGRVRNQHPVFVPLLLFFALAGLATIFSFLPLESWYRLNGFSVLMLAIISAEVLRSRSRIALLTGVLLASGLVAAARTGWQYAHGIGTRISFTSADPAIVSAGLAPGDIIQQIEGEKTRTPEQWQRALEKLRGSQSSSWTLLVARDFPPPIRKSVARVDRRAFLALLAAPTTHLARGRPDRAQGDFAHYMPYAGVLMVLAALAWGMLVAGLLQRRQAAWPLLVVLLSLVAALLATETRSYVATLLLGCLLSLWLVSGWRWRGIALVAALLATVGAGFVIQRQRSVGWVASQDAGTQYRLVIWRDGLRLMQKHPLLGVGPDAVRGNPDAWHMEAYRRFPIKGHFHSTPIEIAVDCGLPALLVWVWLWARYFRLAGGLAKGFQGRDWLLHGVGLAAVAAGAALVASAFVQYNLGDPAVMAIVWLLLGMSAATSRLAEDDASVQRLKVW
jgi:hypothetical protein